ncbi:DNA polymerase III subunit delta, partial [Pseudomonas syringae pv. tagetis]
LLASPHEIQNLKLMAAQVQITCETLQAAVPDSDRFDVFALPDAVLNADAAQAVPMVAPLRGEGVEPPGSLWALPRQQR